MDARFLWIFDGFGGYHLPSGSLTVTAVKKTTTIGRGIALLALLALIATPAFAARPYFDIALDLGYEDNLLRAEEESDRLREVTRNLTASVNYPVPLGEHSGLYLRGALDQEKHQNYGRFDNLRISASATWRYKPDLSYTAPWYSLGMTVADWSYQRSELRDSRVWELEAMVGKRFTDRISGRFGLAYRERHATTQWLGLLNDERLFDMTNRRWFAGLDYRYGPVTLYGQYGVQAGDVVSTAVPTHKVVLASEEIQFDDAAPLSADGRWRFGYRLNATTRLLDLGANIALSRAAALDIALQYADVEAVGGNVYDNLALHVAYMHRFK